MPATLSRTCSAVKLAHKNLRCGQPAVWAFKHPQVDHLICLCDACKIEHSVIPTAFDADTRYYTIDHLLTQGHELEPEPGHPWTQDAAVVLNNLAAHDREQRASDLSPVTHHPSPSLRVMLDLETLGTRPGCAIRAIGACTFAHGKIGREFYVRIDLDSCVRAGLHLDPETVLWWMRQSDEARAEFCNQQDVQALSDALSRFNGWLFSSDSTPDDSELSELPSLSTATGVHSLITHHSSLITELWGNGADFDPPILAASYFAAGYSRLPWIDRSARCYRTMKNLRRYIPFTPPAIRHHALQDAKAQALHLMQIEDALRGSVVAEKDPAAITITPEMVTHICQHNSGGGSVWEKSVREFVEAAKGHTGTP